MIGPPSSGWFESFRIFSGPGDNGVIVPLRDSLLYKLDYLGLKVRPWAERRPPVPSRLIAPSPSVHPHPQVLDESGRLQLHTSDCDHAEHPTEACKYSFDVYTLPLLKQPWPEVHQFWKSQNITIGEQ